MYFFFTNLSSQLHVNEYLFSAIQKKKPSYSQYLLKKKELKITYKVYGSWRHVVNIE